MVNIHAEKDREPSDVFNGIKEDDEDEDEKKSKISLKDPRMMILISYLKELVVSTRQRHRLAIRRIRAQVISSLQPNSPPSMVFYDVILR